jgi:S1-C subfamily serine protease
MLPLRILAQSVADDRFEARMIPDHELRSLQAALTLTGDYNGLLDGAWGRLSQNALDRWSLRYWHHGDPSFADLGPLLDHYDSVLAEAGWKTLYLDSLGFSIGLPDRLLVDGERSRSYITWQTPDRRLLIRAIFSSPQETAAMHRWLMDAHVGPDEFYQSLREDRLISAARLSDGKRAYLRSMPDRRLWFSVLVQSEPSMDREAALIAASMRLGRAPELNLAPGALLRRLGQRPAASPPTPAAPSPAPAPAPDVGARFDPESRKSSGSGFFVNNTDIITAAHVVDGCRNLTLDNGSPLLPVDADASLDLALLSSSRRSSEWLSVSAAVVPRLGEPVYALGYPFLGLFDQGLSVTGGNVSALPRGDDDEARVMVSAPVQPGNSGGPLLNARGEVIGVVVARANDLAVLEREGSLPQNMNFAVPTGRLTGFLNRNRVSFDSAPQDGISVSDGIPDSIQRAVVVIYCF